MNVELPAPMNGVEIRNAWCMLPGFSIGAGNDKSIWMIRPEKYETIRLERCMESTRSFFGLRWLTFTEYKIDEENRYELRLYVAAPQNRNFYSIDIVVSYVGNQRMVYAGEEKARIIKPLLDQIARALYSMAVLERDSREICGLKK